MMKIEIEKDLIPYSFEMELNDIVYTFLVNYNELFDYFTLDVAIEDEILVYGEKLTINKPLFIPLYYRDVPIIMPFDSTEEIHRITFENFDDQVELIFVGDDNEILE